MSLADLWVNSLLVVVSLSACTYFVNVSILFCFSNRSLLIDLLRVDKTDWIKPFYICRNAIEMEVSFFSRFYSQINCRSRFQTIYILQDLIKSNDTQYYFYAYWISLAWNIWFKTFRKPKKIRICFVSKWKIKTKHHPQHITSL